MATFVLVHGGWHGGWSWRRLTPLLRAAGHGVHTPTLTGLGERVHLAGPAVGLDTHIEDVVNLLHYEDLREVVLVGHSYGGMVITGVAGRSAERLARMVYLDAFVPRDGQRLLDLLAAQQATGMVEAARTQGGGLQIPAGPIQRYGVTEEPDLSWATARLVGQPLRTFEQPVTDCEAVVAALQKTYIRCTAFTGPVFDRFGERARTEPGWRYRALDAGHDAMITHPRELAALLLEAAAVQEPA